MLPFIIDNTTSRFFTISSLSYAFLMHHASSTIESLSSVLNPPYIGFRIHLINRTRIFYSLVVADCTSRRYPSTGLTVGETNPI